jgi:hypothetical protein
MGKRRRKVGCPYKEGTWFAVPLQRGGYALGLVARYAARGKIILAYLFGPKRERIPTLDEVSRLEAHEALRVLRVGDLGLIDGSWPVIGDSLRWERDRWPMPAFIRRDEISGVAWRVIYSDEDPNRVLAEHRIPYETPDLESDGLYGSKAAEAVVSQILRA